MTTDIEFLLASLPTDLGGPARRLVEQTRLVTDAGEDTLAACFALLRHVPADPAALDAGHDLLTGEVAAALNLAHERLADAYPAVAAAWRGGGAELFSDYLPRLSLAIETCRDCADGTATAVARYRESAERLWSNVVTTTRDTADQVTATVAQFHGREPFALSSVVSIVEGYADYCEQLVETLVDLGNDHAPGSALAAADRIGTRLRRDGNRMALPPVVDELAEDWRPIGQVAVDLAAMTELTSTLAAGTHHWEHAAANLERAATEHFGTAAFGLAGAEFHRELHRLLVDQHDLYRQGESHMSDLARQLRVVSAHYAAGDDAAGGELRRGLEES